MARRAHLMLSVDWFGWRTLGKMHLLPIAPCLLAHFISSIFVYV
jgi:hypothetical protein